MLGETKKFGYLQGLFLLEDYGAIFFFFYYSTENLKKI